MENADPADVGMDAERVDRFFAVAERMIGEKWLDGGSFLMARRGKVVAARALGHSDAASKRRAQVDDVYLIFSTTKPITATMLLMKVERGDVRLFDRVAEYVPAFAAAGKEAVTVADLLTHRGGFPTFPLDHPLTAWKDWDATVARVCALPVEYPPGTAVHYHALTAQWIQAEICRRVEGSKRSFAEMVAEDLYAPLGMKSSHMGMRLDLAERRVPVRALDTQSFPFPLAFLEAFNHPDVQAAAVPGGGSYSTVHDLARFYQAWLNGGVLDGRRLLSPAMVDLATTNQTGDMPDRLMQQIGLMQGWPTVPAFRGLGFFLRGTGLFPNNFGSLSTPRAFGHPGASSIMAWADPARQLVFVGLTAGLIDEGRNIRRFHLFSDLVQACAVD